MFSSVKRLYFLVVDPKGVHNQNRRLIVVHRLDFATSRGSRTEGTSDVSKNPSGMGLFDMLGDSLKEASKTMLKGKDAAIRGSEKMLRVSRLKMDVQEMREEKDRRMRDLAHRVYELYAQSKLNDQDLVTMCQDIKTLQWQIDERWTEINHINKAD